MIPVPAETGSIVVPPAPFPITRVVSSALYFGMKVTWDHRQRKFMETPKSARLWLTGGNTRRVSYNVLYRWKSQSPEQTLQYHFEMRTL